MPPAFDAYLVSFVVAFISNSLLMRSFHGLEPEEWKASREPFGALWAPKGRRSELFGGMASKSMRSAFAYAWHVFFKTPDWIRKDGRRREHMLLLANRVAGAICVILLVITFVKVGSN